MWKIHHFSETDSTNRLALGGKPGDVFTAAHQCAGRGRLDHKWLSPPGQNLMMSAVVDVAGMDPASVATFPLVVGLAVADALSRFVGGIMLKWPNDVVVSPGGREIRKIAGILCERHGDCVIAGVGINVRQTEFAPEIAGRATSLLLAGADFGIDDVRDAVLDSLAQLLHTWRSSGFEAILPRISRIDALKGRFVTVRRTDDDSIGVSGICGGVAPDGSLLVGAERIYSGEAHVSSFY